MGKVPRTASSFTVEGPWCGVARAMDNRVLQNPRRDLRERILAGARGRLDRDGHSHFLPGELASLEVVARGTGELRTVSRQGVEKAIANLVEDGDLQPGSGLLCLMLWKADIQYRFNAEHGTECPRGNRPQRSPEGRR